MIFCEQCGNKLNDSAKFCGKCGTPVAAGQAEATQPSAPGASNEESPAKKAFNAGMACIDAEQFDEAIAHFSETIRLRPDAADPYAKRGYAYEEKGEHDLAIADYNEALRIAPNSDAAYCLRGLAYYMKDQYENAFADFNQAIQIDPNKAHYYGYRGITYLEVGDVANANADLQRGLQLDPNDGTVQQLAEALNDAGGQGGMSAPGACTQCGSPLEEGEMFCANCGAKVGAVPQQQGAPAQAQRQGVGGEVLKEVPCLMINPPTGLGSLRLYGDRLEWKGDILNVFPFHEISTIKPSWGSSFKITMDNYKIFEFQPSKGAIDALLHASEVEEKRNSWIADIKSLCPHLK